MDARMNSPRSDSLERLSDFRSRDDRGSTRHHEYMELAESAASEFAGEAEARNFGS
jgi:hypothetical protein